MALTRFIIALFAVLVNLAFTGAEAFNGGNACWNMAISVSGCGDDSGSIPDLCLCRSSGMEEIFFQLQEYCAQNGWLYGYTPDQVCTNLLHAREAAPAVTALAVRTALAAPSIYQPHPLSPGFCALPGTFCSFEDDDADEAAPTVTAIAVRTVTSIYQPHPLSPGFCALPGTFCSFEDEEVEEADFAVITGIAPRVAESTSTHAHSSGFCGLPGAFCQGGVVDERADGRIPAVITPPFETSRQHGPRPTVPAYPTMVPERRSNDDSVLPLKAGTMGNGADSQIGGGLKLALGFVIGWIGALMMI